MAADAIRNAPISGDWPHALKLIATASGGWGCSLVSSSKKKGVLACALGGISEQLIIDAVEAGGLDPAINPRLSTLRQSEPLRVRTEADFTKSVDWFASPFYQNFAARVDAPFSEGAKLDSAYDEITTLSVWRSASQGPAGPDDTAVLSGLLPILKDALDIQCELSRRNLCFSAHAWDHTNTPVFYCDAHLKVLAMSAAGERAASASNILQLKRNRLHLPTEREQRRLARAVAAASRRFAGAASEVKIEATSADGAETAVIAVAPVSGEDAAALLCPAALVILLDVVSNSDQRGKQPRIHLTQAEEDIGRLLLQGYTTRQIADRRGSRLSTVQTQIKVMNQKLNADHRAQLLARLQTFLEEK